MPPINEQRSVINKCKVEIVNQKLLSMTHLVEKKRTEEDHFPLVDILAVLKAELCSSRS